jgi:hypothetical protein
MDNSLQIFLEFMLRDELVIVARFDALIDVPRWITTRQSALFPTAHDGSRLAQSLQTDDGGTFLLDQYKCTRKRLHAPFVSMMRSPSLESSLLESSSLESSLLESSSLESSSPDFTLRSRSIIPRFFCPCQTSTDLRTFPILLADLPPETTMLSWH